MRAPLQRCSPTTSARRLKAFTANHSVCSCGSPSLSFHRSVVATENCAMAVPCWLYVTSGLRPRYPISRTFCMALSLLIENVRLIARVVRRVLCPPKRDTALRHATLEFMVDHSAGRDGSGGRVRTKSGTSQTHSNCGASTWPEEWRAEGRCAFHRSRRLLVPYAEIWRSFYRVSLRAFRTFRRVISSAAS